MNVLFAGPTLHDLVVPGRTVLDTDIVCRAPARQGDIARAVLDGATAIGLIDGRYEDVAAPWHKEILFALSRGVAVFGGASMGALRAAECAEYGMVSVGAIAERYISGDLTDDAAVAQLHAPPELGCVPLTEALVNVEATVERARDCGALTRYEADLLDRSARRIFFKDRTFGSVVRGGGFSGAYGAVLLNRLAECRRDVKREDALELVEAMATRCPAATASAPAPGWVFRETTAWRQFLLSMHH